MPDGASLPLAPLRPPAHVMRLRRMGASFPTRLSFLRCLTRALAAEQAVVRRTVWQINDKGFGHAVYQLRLGGFDYALVAVSNDLPDDARSDRVIATAWDSAFVLYDGIPDAAEIARIVAAAPKQEAGRFTRRDLVLSRANKSVRLFGHVVDSLRAGQQPDEAQITGTGYLMRTTAVYGNGKFGIADRAEIAARPHLGLPFAAEMLTVWLIRGFTHDLVEHLGGAPLDRRLKRHLGIGNSTGLGMAPFLVSHPQLLDAWITARETALARVCALEEVPGATQQRLRDLADRAYRHLREWRVDDRIAADRIETLTAEWPQVIDLLAGPIWQGPRPIAALLEAVEGLSVDCQELVTALVIEPFGDLVDDLAPGMATDWHPHVDPGMTLPELRSHIARDWNWACEIDFAKASDCAQFWYVSEAKLEPRLGDRHAEPGAERESPLDVARQVKTLAGDLEGQEGTVAAFLRSHPQHRAAVRRVQTVARHPYAEIRDNLIGAECLPIDMLRCKLAFFGASKFDPRSDRWTRITLAQGAPLFDELETLGDDWWLPAFAA